LRYRPDVWIVIKGRYLESAVGVAGDGYVIIHPAVITAYPDEVCHRIAKLRDEIEQAYFPSIIVIFLHDFDIYFDRGLIHKMAKFGISWWSAPEGIETLEEAWEVFFDRLPIDLMPESFEDLVLELAEDD